MVFVDSSLGDGDCVVRYSRSFGKENNISLYTEIRPKGDICLGIRARIGDQIEFAKATPGDEVRLQAIATSTMTISTR